MVTARCCGVLMVCCGHGFTVRKKKQTCGFTASRNNVANTTPWKWKVPPSHDDSDGDDTGGDDDDDDSDFDL